LLLRNLPHVPAGSDGGIGFALFVATPHVGSVEPKAGSRVFLKGLVPKTGKDVTLGILNAQGNVAVVNFPPKEAADEQVRPLARWFRRLLDRWQIDGRVSLGGSDDAWDLYAGYLEGDGYTLAAVCNLSSRDPRQLIRLIRENVKKRP
jgi:hypothetical protein